ncbi:MAG TPA: hypothetical protein VHO70_17735, partial [Chitinispirillaceae bacterium]|nr:hypothetical protein [Chitinispirillaceae bacterium]
LWSRRQVLWSRRSGSLVAPVRFSGRAGQVLWSRRSGSLVAPSDSLSVPLEKIRVKPEMWMQFVLFCDQAFIRVRRSTLR